MAAPAHEHAHCGCGGDHQLFEALDLASLHLQATLVEAASTAAAQAQIAAVRARFATEWHQAAGVFRQRASLIRRGTDPLTGAKLADKAARTAAAKLALEELERAWQKTITRHWQNAFKLGWSSRGKLPPDTTLEIQTLSPRFKALVEGQHAAAVKFAQDLAQGIVGKPGRQSYAQRAQAYANATGAAFHAAAVDAGEPGELIIWNLSAADHCRDCPTLAAFGPYTRDTLPTVPKSGVECLSNCKCYLTFVKGKAPAAPATPADQVVSTAIGDPPQAPIGWRVPTDTERDTLRDLEARMNFARRQIALTPPDSAEQRRWIRDRRALNQALRELTERERIYHVPTFSVPEVVSGFNVAATEVTELVAARGVDGATAAVAGGEAAAAAEGAADVQAAVRLAQATPTLPVVPSAAALKRAALPPPEGEDGTQEGHDAGFDLAEADVPVSAALPAQFTWQTVSVVGLGARHTLALSLSLLRLLAEAPTPYAVEVGPFDDEHWATLTMELGIWLRGPGEEIERLLKDWAEVAPKPGLGVAPYLP